MQDKMAVLGNCEDMTSFSYAGRVIRFRTKIVKTQEFLTYKSETLAFFTL